jgi:hypothetical protein
MSTVMSILNFFVPTAYRIEFIHIEDTGCVFAGKYDHTLWISGPQLMGSINTLYRDSSGCRFQTKAQFLA